jgi:hypothetical protein
MLELILQAYECARSLMNRLVIGFIVGWLKLVFYVLGVKPQFSGGITDVLLGYILFINLIFNCYVCLLS